MALFDKQVELITESDLASLMENQEREGYQIEYKQEVAFKDKQDKLDFLAAVSSFANSVGGDLLVGVAATSGIPSGIPGWAGVDLDQEKLRIESLLRDQVEPRIAFKLREIPLQNGNTVLLVRVPWSWAQPHMVRMDQVNRFYYRHSAGKAIMDVSQLRAAFALSNSLEEQIATFRRERTAEIKAGSAGHLTPPPGPTVVVHLVPFESFRSGGQLDLGAAMKHAQGCILPLGTGANRYSFNLDGIYCVDYVQDCGAYTHVFRNGIVESANRLLLVPRQGRHYIPSSILTEKVIEHVKAVVELYRRLNVSPPVVAMMTLVRVRNYEFASRDYYGTHAVDRDDLPLPGTLIPDFSQSAVDICRPIFDALWNAVGFAKWPE
ncbi:MAG TPA: ATP-binding protein [Bryobacteraceae bacterium]|nr:ATP-binding protein [Bryobacteraceae bacterium]